jgi:GAF domain-containing protein
MERLCIETEKFFNILNSILSTLDINEILTTVVREIQTILRAERCTLYVIDKEHNELYSKVLQADDLVEIRVSINKESLAGYTALTGRIINIKDAYDDSELKAIDREFGFDRSWDEKSGYRTKSVLVMPIPLTTKSDIIGVFQALNKPGGFSKFDLETMEQLAYLLGIALNNAILYRAIDEEKKLRGYIIDDIDEGICILDTKRRIISANKFLEVMSGMRYTSEAMVGESFFDLFPNFADTQLEEKINEVFLYGFKKIALLEVLEIKIIPYLDDAGRVKRLILIFTRV